MERRRGESERKNGGCEGTVDEGGGVNVDGGRVNSDVVIFYKDKTKSAIRKSHYYKSQETSLLLSKQLYSLVEQQV